jgi:hypothetical protein
MVNGYFYSMICSAAVNLGGGVAIPSWSAPVCR